jgi:predicted nucleic acid-binding protein
LVESIAVLALNRDAAVQAAAIRRARSRTGSAISMADSLIAGIALANGLPLFTRNRKHFEKIEGLQLE